MDTSIPVGYLYSGYPRGYGAATCIILIQWSGDRYYIIRTYGYPLTSPIQNEFEYM